MPCLFNHVSDRYFETMGIPILSGRAFTHAEIERQEAVAVVSESAARALWPGKDPLANAYKLTHGRRVSCRKPTRLSVS